MPLISSILIINENGIYEGVARYAMPEILLSNPKEAPWYRDLHQLKGLPLFLINGGGYFSPKEEGNYISLIRLINSTETARPIGYMMINISMDSLLSLNQDNNNSYSGICVYAQGQIILSSLNKSLDDYIQNSSPERIPPSSDIIIDNERYLLLNYHDSMYDWNYLSAIKYTNFSNETKPFIMIFLLTMLTSGTLFLFIAFYTNHSLTNPLHRLMNAMKKTENGNFKHAYVTKYTDEIGLLQDAYNEMVDKIQNLLESKVYEQKLLRKAELNTMQEQIKPHFLYNSLSAIAYLITSEQNEKAYDLIISLSEYYRESLSKGSEIVSLSTEINIVKNYLKLQKMRFPDVFYDVYELQEETLSLPVPRLILQPLVENSLYHGIIPTCEYGMIKIQTYIEHDRLILCISDNGLGISPDRISEILGDKLGTNAMSFGLRRTVERLQIFYDDKNIYEIKSTPHNGTKITFSLPLQKMEEYHESE
jgi:two-component system sensor histidine kinase YesM